MTSLESWLDELGLGRLAPILAERRLDLDVLPDLSDADIAELDLPLGDRLRLRRAVAALRGVAAAAPPPPPPETTEQRRLASVLFLDIADSTALMRRVGLESYRGLLLAFRETASREIAAAGGYVAQFQGDGVIACFGFPSASEDFAARAAETALVLLARLGTLGEAGAALSGRAAVATGEVLIGDIHHDWRASEGAVLGDAPNLASRLQAVAETGGLLVCPETRAMLRSEFECRPEPPLRLKGFAGETRPWRVLARHGADSRFEARRTGPLAPLVGREDELATLAARWAETRRGEGRAVLLQGDAGIGKSRLAREFADRHGAEALRLTWQCVAGCETSPLHPFIDRLRRPARRSGGGAGAEADMLRRAALAAGLPADRAEAFGDWLLAAVAPRAEAEAVDGAGRRERLIPALVETMRELSERKPLVMIVEDVHWADPSTLELLAGAAEAVRDMRAMLICTSREFGVPAWAPVTHVVTLGLPRLSLGMARDLAARLAPAGVTPQRTLLDAVAERSEGVPLFVEELTRAWISGQPAAGGGEDAAEPRLPSTLREVLEARLDVSGAPRELASTCAAFVQGFTPRLLAATLGRPLETLRAPLEAMVETGLVQAAGSWPDLACRFAHALFRETAYRSMTGRRRRATHLAVAEALRRENPEMAREEPEGLAHHLEAGEAWADARDCWAAAARRAAAAEAEAEAIGRFEAALRCNAALRPGPERDASEAAIRRELRLPLERRAWGSQALEANLAALLRLEHEASDDDRYGELLYNLHGRALIAGEVDLARRFIEMLDSVAARSERPELRAMVHRGRGFCAFMTGSHDEALGAFDACLALRARAPLEAIRRYYAADPWAPVQAMAAWSHAWRGEAARSEARAAAAIADAEASGDSFSRAFVLSVLAAAAATEGDAARTVARADAVLSGDPERLSPYWAAWCRIARGWARGVGGEAEAGRAELAEGAAAYEATGARQVMPFARTLQTDLALRLGLHEEAARGLAALAAVEAATTVRFHRPWADRLEAAIGPGPTPPRAEAEGRDDLSRC